MQMLPWIEEGHIVLRLGGEIDREGARAVAGLIEASTHDFFIDFTDVTGVEEAGFTVLADAIHRCPHRLVLTDAARLGLS